MGKHKSKAKTEPSAKADRTSENMDAPVPPPPPADAPAEAKQEQEAPASPPMTEAAEKLGHALKHRKSVEEVQDAGILKTEEDAERKARVAEAVEQHIEERPSQDEMHAQQAHIVNPSGASRRLSGSLVPTAVELEKKMTADAIDQHLQSRPAPEELEHRHVIDEAHGRVAPQLQSVKKQLEKQMSSDDLSHRLERRPELDELKSQGIVRDGGVAPSLVAAQEQLQRKMAANKVNQHLMKRPSSDELEAKGLLDDKDIAPSLSATAKKLERTFVQNQVGHLLDTRPDKDALQNQNILGDTPDAVSALIQDTKNQLERHLKADDLSRQLRKRPSVGELEDKGIVDRGELGDEDTNVKQCSLSRRARYTLALKAASRIAADNLISEDEKSRLKDLILTDDEQIAAALESYEQDQNVEELLNSLYRVAKQP